MNDAQAIKFLEEILSGTGGYMNERQFEDVVQRIVEETSGSNFDDVGKFHEKFELDNVTHRGPGPRLDNEELIRFRLNFMLEELLEFAEAHNYVIGFHPQKGKFEFNLPGPNAAASSIDREKSFDSLLDLAYVVFGTAHVLGYPWHEGWAEVQRANMTKERVQRAEDSARGSTFDVIKPKGWTPPGIQTILERHGWYFEEHTKGPIAPEKICQHKDKNSRIPCIANTVERSNYCAIHQKDHEVVAITDTDGDASLLVRGSTETRKTE